MSRCSRQTDTHIHPLPFPRPTGGGLLFAMFSLFLLAKQCGLEVPVSHGFTKSPLPFFLMGSPPFLHLSPASSQGPPSHQSDGFPCACWRPHALGTYYTLGPTSKTLRNRRL